MSFIPAKELIYSQLMLSSITHHRVIPFDFIKEIGPLVEILSFL